MSADSPEAPDLNGSPPGEADHEHHGGKKHKNKVRAAWISFIGRIVAQIAGAAATIVLGLAVVSKLTGGGDRGSTSGNSPPPVPCRVELSSDKIDLAVLPFENLSTVAGGDGLADGITEGLIGNLSRLPSLDVISRTSSMYYKGLRKSLPEVAAELRVDFVVEGTVSGDDRRLRITARLTDAVADHELWAQVYERASTNRLSLQTEVAAAISREINATIVPALRRPSTGLARIDSALCDDYVKGRAAARLRTVPEFHAAIRHFEQALRADAGFAPAHAGLASTYVLLGLSADATVPLQSALGLARTSAARALEIDSGLAEAHAVLALVAHRLDWDWGAAETIYRRAASLESREPLAHQWYGMFLAEQARHREALTEAELAAELDPLMPDVHTTLGFVHYYAGRFDRAASAARRALEINPEAVSARLVLAWSLIERGDAAAAITVCEERSWRGAFDQMLATIADAYRRSGKPELADATGRELLTLEAISPAALLRWHISRGEIDAAFDVLERAVAGKSTAVSAIRTDPLFASLRRDQRFNAVLVQLKFR